MENLKKLHSAYANMADDIATRLAFEAEPAERRTLMDQYVRNCRMRDALEVEMILVIA